MPDSAILLWRTGRKVGRTIYAYFMYEDEAGNGVWRESSWLIGVMDTPELAQAAVEAHNAAVADHPANAAVHAPDKEQGRG